MEENIKKILNILKNEHYAVSIKAEFEDEGSCFKQVQELKRIADEVGMELTVKIGGCGALSDARFCRNINSNAIVAPMIESEYATKKFVLMSREVFGEGLPALFINIETITGFNNLENILACEFSKYLTGIVVGKCDMARSLNLQPEEINGELILSIVEKIEILCKKYGKKLVIGGGISKDSVNFFDKLPQKSLYRFETRKIIFDAQKTLMNKPLEAIQLALKFEKLWLEYCADIFDFELDLNRVQTIEKRLCLLSC